MVPWSDKVLAMSRRCSSVGVGEGRPGAGVVVLVGGGVSVRMAVRDAFPQLLCPVSRSRAIAKGQSQRNVPHRVTAAFLRAMFSPVEGLDLVLPGGRGLALLGFAEHGESVAHRFATCRYGRSWLLWLLTGCRDCLLRRHGAQCLCSRTCQEYSRTCVCTRPCLSLTYTSFTLKSFPDAWRSALLQRLCRWRS